MVHSELYEESDGIDYMIEDNDDCIIVNDDTEYSGENSMDGKPWRTKGYNYRRKRIKHNAL